MKLNILKSYSDGNCFSYGWNFILFYLQIYSYYHVKYIFKKSYYIKGILIFQAYFIIYNPIYYLII